MPMHLIFGRRYRYGIRNTQHITTSCTPCSEDRIDVKSQAYGNKKRYYKWFGKILQRNPKIEVTEFSEMFPNKGTKKYYRTYVEVRKSNVKEKQ